MKKLADVTDEVYSPTDGDIPEHVRSRMKGCLDCGTPGTWTNGEGPLDGRCRECSVKRLVEADSSIDKAKALFRMGVPAAYRKDPPWLGEGWQFDPAWPTGRACGDWPNFAMEDGIWSIVLSGVNGSGKSVAAAHLLHRLWVAGYRPATTDSGTPLPMWAGELEIVDEDRISGYGEARHLRQAVYRQPAMVWDDIGSSDAWRVVFPMIETRHANGLLTIFTTHRPLSARKAEALGVAGSSIEEVSPEVYSRLRDGWIGRWGERPYRGAAAAVPA